MVRSTSSCTLASESYSRLNRAASRLKLSGGDIKAVQSDSGHAQADMVTEVYGHIIDEERRRA